MKKTILIGSIALIALTSCGSSTEGETAKSDSTTVATAPIDSTITLTDSTETPVDTTTKTN